MKIRYILTLSCVLLLPGLLLGSCNGIPGSASISTSTPAVTDSPDVPAVSKTQTPETSQAKRLTIWLPDRLSNRNTNDLLPIFQSQIDEFQANHPNTLVELRLKNSTGPANLMDSLQNASLAAPQVLPDLVLLTREEMEVAALKGLLIPYDGVTDLLSANDWIEPVRQLSAIQGSTFGIPVASDALVFIYPVEEIDPPNPFTQGKPTLCFLDDPKAYLPIMLYLNAGGNLSDETGQPVVDQEAFVSMLETISFGRQTGALPSWSMDITQPEDVFRYFTSGRGDSMVTWYADTALPILAVSGVSPVHVTDEKSASLVKGWFWSMTQPDPSNRTDTVALAEALADEAFLAKLARTADLLPVRKSPAILEDPILASKAEIVSSSQPVPDGLFLVTISPVLQDAVRQLFSNILSPEEITTGLMDRLQRP